MGTTKDLAPLEGPSLSSDLESRDYYDLVEVAEAANRLGTKRLPDYTLTELGDTTGPNRRHVPRGRLSQQCGLRAH
jgi:hypothetical protein